jgi:hypothetical protein
MNVIQKFTKLAVLSLAIVATSLSFTASASAATTTPKPSMEVKYVGTCLHPGVQFVIKNFSYVGDVYYQTDTGTVLANTWYEFNKANVYAGGIALGGVYQVNVFVTAPDAGPYAKHILDKSVAAATPCNGGSFPSIAPANAIPVEVYYLAWYPNR